MKNCGRSLLFGYTTKILERYPNPSLKNTSQKIICQKNISQNVRFPELAFVRNHTRQNEHLPKFTSVRMNSGLKLHFPGNLFTRFCIFQNSISRIYVFPKIYFPEFVLGTT